MSGEGESAAASPGPWAKRLRLVGMALAALCVFILLRRLLDASTELPPEVWRLADAGRLAQAALLYLAALGALALGWWCLLRARGDRPPASQVATVTFLAQVGKYLPGSVGQYVGRVELLRPHAVGRGPAVRVLAGEGLVLVALALAAAPLVIEALDVAAPAPGGLPWPALADFFAELLAAVAGRPRVAWTFAVIGSAAAAAGGLWLAGAGPRGLSALPPYSSYLLLQGLSLAVLAAPLSERSAPLGVVLASFAVSWVAGFVVLGAPAGLGVRDFVLVVLLTPALGEPAALAAALAHRWVVTAGDGLALLLGLALRSLLGRG
ncbi:MAG: hypothetical protein AAGF23_17920 [Acidobacteriota bacterium]